MSGQLPWMIALVLLVGMPMGFFTAALVRYAHARYRYRFEAEKECVIACPQSGGDVECLLTHNAKTGEWADVLACSAQSGGVKCEKRCIYLLNQGIPLVPSPHSRAENRSLPLADPSQEG